MVLAVKVYGSGARSRMTGNSDGCVRTRFGEIGKTSGKSGILVAVFCASSFEPRDFANWSKRLTSVGSLLHAKDQSDPRTCKFGIRPGTSMGL